jgi:hypothetical protein
VSALVAGTVEVRGDDCPTLSFEFTLLNSHFLMLCWRAIYRPIKTMVGGL